MLCLGGSLGWKIRGSLDAAFEKAAYDLVCHILLVIALIIRTKRCVGTELNRESKDRRGQDGAWISYHHGGGEEMMASGILRKCSQIQDARDYTL